MGPWARGRRCARFGTCSLQFDAAGDKSWLDQADTRDVDRRSDVHVDLDEYDHDHHSCAGVGRRRRDIRRTGASCSVGSRRHRSPACLALECIVAEDGPDRVYERRERSGPASHRR